jgi:REP element-mobilizing transposase RayT
MTIRKTLNYSNCIYYCTFTCYKWLNLFEITSIYDSVYKWFDVLSEKNQIRIVAYVIMPNHLHIILFVGDSAKSINKVIADGKRFIAYEVVKRLKISGEKDLLKVLESGISIKDKKRGKLHQVFEESSDIKVLTSEYMIEQKIQYIHMNPVSKSWNLIHDYIKYEHSSAGFHEGLTDYKGYKNIFNYF